MGAVAWAASATTTGEAGGVDTRTSPRATAPWDGAVMAGEHRDPTRPSATERAPKPFSQFCRHREEARCAANPRVNASRRAEPPRFRRAAAILLRFRETLCAKGLGHPKNQNHPSLTFPPPHTHRRSQRPRRLLQRRAPARGGGFPLVVAHRRGRRATTRRVRQLQQRRRGHLHGAFLFIIFTYGQLD